MPMMRCFPGGILIGRRWVLKMPMILELSEGVYRFYADTPRGRRLYSGELLNYIDSNREIVSEVREAYLEDAVERRAEDKAGEVPVWKKVGEAAWESSFARTGLTVRRPHRGILEVQGAAVGIGVFEFHLSGGILW